MISDRLPSPIPITQHNWRDDVKPLVSVFNWVYNHKDYIRESIESILVQKTNFPVEIIIHDDASNDGTAEIIREYENRYPKLFRNILQTENQWSQGKSVMTPLFEKPQGKYIALTHGDDYWTDPLKLQKQVEVLEEEKDVVIVHTRVKYLKPDGKLYPMHGNPSEYTNLLDMIYMNHISTCSSIFRNILNIQDYNVINLKGISMGDYILWLVLLAKYPNQRIKFMSDQTAVYRYGRPDSITNVISPINFNKSYIAIHKHLFNNKILSQRDKRIYLQSLNTINWNTLKLIEDKIKNKNYFFALIKAVEVLINIILIHSSPVKHTLSGSILGGKSLAKRIIKCFLNG